MNLPLPLTQLIDELSKLPSIGKKSAQRLAYALLLGPESNAQALSEAIVNAKSEIRDCERCFSLTDSALCPICLDPRRDQKIICG